jgi:hypothetical protein
MKSIGVWDVTPCSVVEINLLEERTCTVTLIVTCWFLSWLNILSWRRRQYSSPKRRCTWGHISEDSTLCIAKYLVVRSPVAYEVNRQDDQWIWLRVASRNGVAWWQISKAGRCQNLRSTASFQILYFFFNFLGWGETESTCYVGHYLTYCTSSRW